MIMKRMTKAAILKGGDLGGDEGGDEGGDLGGDEGGDDDNGEPQSEQEVEEEVTSTIEAAQQEFKDGSPVEQQVKDEAIINNIDEFFGQIEGKPSFMNRFFLSDQAAMLYGLVGNLNKILGKETGKEGGKDKALREEEEERDYVTIPWSRNGKTSLKKELGAFAALLREAKRLAEAYNTYATQSSVDPRFDGSSLKKALTGEDGQGGIMGDVQWHTAKLADLLAQTIAGYKKEETLQEALSGDEKKEAISVIRDTYNKLGQMYINSLKPSLSGKLDEQEEEAPTTISSVDNEAAQRTAQEMLDLISKDPNIIKYFPRGIVNSQGKVVTLETATKALDAQIAAFGKVLRDIYMTTKDKSIAPSDITRAYGVLKTLAQAIENSFGVDSLIKRKADKILTKATSEDETSITDEPPVEVEVEEETYAHEDNEIYQDLTQEEREAVDEFVRIFLEVSGSLEESEKPKKSINKKGRELSKKLMSGLSLTVPQIKLIVNRMDREKLFKFQRTMMLKPQIIDMILDIYASESSFFEKPRPQTTDPEAPRNEKSRKIRDRIKGNRVTNRTREEQLIRKLTPIIEKILKEQ